MSGLKKLIISKSNNKFIYLISPNKINNNNFYSQLKEIFKSKKIAFFQLRLKKESNKNKIIIGKKIQKLCKKYKVKYKASLKILNWAKKTTNIPIVAIGGIKMDNYKKLLLNKANFLAISSYIWNNKKYKPIEAIKKFK